MGKARKVIVSKKPNRSNSNKKVKIVAETIKVLQKLESNFIK